MRTWVEAGRSLIIALDRRSEGKPERVGIVWRPSRSADRLEGPGKADEPSCRRTGCVRHRVPARGEGGRWQRSTIDDRGGYRWRRLANRGMKTCFASVPRPGLGLQGRVSDDRPSVAVDPRRSVPSSPRLSRTHPPDPVRAQQGSSAMYPPFPRCARGRSPAPGGRLRPLPTADASSEHPTLQDPPILQARWPGRCDALPGCL